MATNRIPAVDNDPSSRENKRIRFIQSEVEAAATREAQDYYISCLTENYKKQLETMEQGHEEQTRKLMSQLAESEEKKENEGTKKARLEAAELHAAVEMKLRKTEWELAESRKSSVAAGDRASKPEQEIKNLKRNWGERLIEVREQHEVKLKKALRDKDKASRHWIEIRLTKRRANAVAAPTMFSPKFAVRRCSTMFSELFQTTVKGETVKAWRFEYKGRPIPTTDLNKTLTDVSSGVIRDRQDNVETNELLLTWL